MERRRLVAKWLGNDIWVNIAQSVFRLPIPYHLGSLKTVHTISTQGTPMKSSARNQLAGTIHSIEDFSGCHSIAVQCGSHLVYSHISPQAYRSLKPQIGQSAVVLFKANAITLFAEIHPLRLSAENSIEARVEAIEQGAVNNIVRLRTRDGIPLAAAITLNSSESLDIRAGQRITAVFLASQTMLAVL